MSKLDTPKFKNSHIIVLIIVAIVGLISQKSAIMSPFWDYEVYKLAIDRFNGGLNPYDIDDNKLLFIYPPIFLRFFSKFSFPEAYAILIAMMTIGAGYALSSLRSSTPFAVLGFLTGGSGFISILTGNFTIFGHFFIISMAYASYKHDKSIIYPAFLALSIFTFSIFKIYFLPYAVVFIILPHRRIWFSVGVILCVLIAFIAQPIFDTTLWTAFQTALYKQTLAKGDVGFTLFSVIYLKFGLLIEGLALHELTVFSIFGTAVILRQLNGETASKINNESELFYILAVIILLNPRLKEYDFSAYMTCIYVAIYLSPKNRGGIGSIFSYTIPLVGIAPIIVSMVSHSIGFHVSYLDHAVYLLIAYIALLMAAVRLWPFHDRSVRGGRRAMPEFR